MAVSRWLLLLEWRCASSFSTIHCLNAINMCIVACDAAHDITIDRICSVSLVLNTENMKTNTKRKVIGGCSFSLMKMFSKNDTNIAT